MKKILVIITIAGIIVGSLLYHSVLMFSKGSFTIDSKLLFGAFAIMVMWCLYYMIRNILRLDKAVEQIAKANEEIVKANIDMKLMLKTIVENQLHHEINAERLHRNTRVMLYEAITESEDSDGGNEE